jgi:hypothetical protein
MKIDLLKTKIRETLNDKDINQYKHLLKDAIEYIGHIDSELRDDLILEYLFRLFIEADLDDKILNETVLELLLNLNEGIDEVSDKVFKRTFSMLALVALIKRHTITPWIDHDLQDQIINKSIHAFSKEKDMRGYVEDKGWAHAGAHGADLFLAISNLERISKKDLNQMLDILYSKLCLEQNTFHLGEDKRMARAASFIFKNEKMDRGQVKIWIRSFTKIDNRGIELVVSKSNGRNFLTALSVYMKHDDEIVKLCHEVIEYLVLE